MWPYLTGTVTTSPRATMIISCGSPGVAGGAVIDGDYKLVLDVQTYGFWQGPVYPNASTNHKLEKPFECGSGGCLFDIQKDPSEYTDLASTMTDKLKEMQQLYTAGCAAKWNNAPKVKTDAEKCNAYLKVHDGYLGPYYGP